jgi:hypothetical protein
VSVDLASVQRAPGSKLPLQSILIDILLARTGKIFRARNIYGETSQILQATIWSELQNWASKSLLGLLAARRAKALAQSAAVETIMALLTQ